MMLDVLPDMYLSESEKHPIIHNMNTKNMAPLPEVTTTQHFQRWNQIAQDGQVASILFSPFTDRVRRIRQYVESLSQKEREAIEIINVIAQDIRWSEDLDRLLEKKRVSHAIIYPAESLFQPDKSHLIPHIISLYQSKKLSLLFFFELFSHDFFTHPLVKLHITLQHNVFEYPTYTKLEVFHFISYLCKSLSAELSDQEKESIFQHCGGYLWLVKDVVQSRKNNINTDLLKIFHSESFQWKVKQIWEAFPLISKETLLAYSLHTTSLAQDAIVAELKKLHIISEEFEQKFPKFLLEAIQNENRKLLFEDHGSVVYRGRDITLRFSLSERHVLVAMLKKDGVTLSREEIAQEWWGDSWEKEYSDWALDKNISRLREKMKSLGIVRNIQTKRGHGYGLT